MRLAEIDDLVEDLCRGIDAGAIALGLDRGDAIGDHGATTVLGEDASSLEDGFIARGFGHDMLAGPRTRCPRVVLELTTSAKETGTMSVPSRTHSQRTGRTKVS